MSAETMVDSDVLDLRELVQRIWVKRWWVILTTLAVTAGFVMAALVVTPIYRASIVLVSASADRNSLNGSLSSALGQLGGLASLAGVNVGTGDSATEEALAVLRSRHFTDSFINDMNLMPELFASRWDEAAGKWIGESQPSAAKAFNYFNKNIRTISQDKKTGLITVQIEWRDGRKAAAWANELVRRINSEMRDRAIAKANASIGFLQKELVATTTFDTRDAINRLIEAQIKQRMLANVTQEFAFRVLDEAVAPDKDDPVRPKKILLYVGGPIIGFAVGVVFVLLFGRGKARRSVG